MTVKELAALPEAALHETLTACCGSRHWVAAVARTKPWFDREALFSAARSSWRGLSREELAEAIAHHPRLGESQAAASLSARARAWSASEQSGTREADAATKAALAQGNLDYEARFGQTFILCANGRSAAQMLSALRERLTHDAETEFTVTSDELWKITRLRLEKLLPSA